MLEGQNVLAEGETVEIDSCFSRVNFFDHTSSIILPNHGSLTTDGFDPNFVDSDSTSPRGL